MGRVIIRDNEVMGRMTNRLQVMNTGTGDVGLARKTNSSEKAQTLFSSSGFFHVVFPVLLRPTLTPDFPTARLASSSSPQATLRLLDRHLLLRH